MSRFDYGQWVDEYFAELAAWWRLRQHTWEWKEDNDMGTRWFAFTVGARMGDYLKAFSNEADLHRYLDKSVYKPGNWVVIKSTPIGCDGDHTVEVYHIGGPEPTPKFRLIPFD